MNEAKKEEEWNKTNKGRKWNRGVNKMWNGGIIDTGESKLVFLETGRESSCKAKRSSLM